MSRSYNKTSSELHLNYKTEAEFNHARNCWLANAPKPEITRPYPPKPLVRAMTWWGRMGWVEAPYNSLEYRKWSRKREEWFFEQYKSEAYLNWQEAQWFPRSSHGKQTWKEYVAFEKAKIRSDRFSRYKGGVPRAFIRLHHHKPRRASDRMNIQHGYRLTEYEDWGDLMFIKQHNDAGWYWY